MDSKELLSIISDIQASPKECEWVEIKKDNSNPQIIGEYISALSNGAAYMGQSKGYLVYGIDDNTHEIIGTHFKPKQEKIGNQEIENWIATLLNLGARPTFAWGLIRNLYLNILKWNVRFGKILTTIVLS